MADASRARPAPKSARMSVAFVNLRSGGRRAAEYVLRKLCEALGQDRVRVLFEGGDADHQRAELDLFLRRQAPDIVIVAGGDGTISFIMDVVKRLQNQKLLSVTRGVIAPFPLGTGNDLSFTLGFGSGFARWLILGERRFRRLMRTYEVAGTTSVDRWSLRVSRSTATRHSREVVQNYVLNNYFSVGFDAAVANRLNRFRGRHPYLFTTRPVVKLWYAAFAALALFTEKKIGASIQLDIDGSRVSVPESAKAVAVCNMLTYAGGAIAWNSAAPDRYARPSVCDGRVEVVCFYGIWHLALVRLGWCYGKKLGQGSAIRIETGCHACQFDGEEVISAGYADGRLTLHIDHFSRSECLTVPPRLETNAFFVVLTFVGGVLAVLVFFFPFVFA